MNYKVRFYVIKLINKICKCVNVTCFYETNYGVKVFNRKKGNGAKCSNKPNIIIVNPDELYLGVDGLKDKYTLVDVKIVDSPHFGLIQHSAINDVSECDYVKRERQGSLDGRDTVYYSDEYHMQSYKNVLSLIENDYSPILIYTIKNNHYIADGKHRAALLAYHKIPIKCREIKLSNVTISYMRELHKKMMRNSAEYSKNINLIESIIREYEENKND